MKSVKKSAAEERARIRKNKVARDLANSVRKTRTRKTWQLPVSSGSDEALLDSSDFPRSAATAGGPQESIIAAANVDISFGFENPLKERFGENFFKDLPKDPGVYTFLNARGQPLYIGKANNLKARLMSYQAAKPGQAPDHILEMIEHAHELKFELRTNEKDALRREEELIRSVRPPYNVALNYDVSYLYIGFKVEKSRTVNTRVEFRLSHMDVKEGFAVFGCFRHRGKAKAAYSALMRILFAAFCPRDRFQLPSKICRSSPAYQYVTEIPVEAVEHLEAYFSGRNNDLLRYLLDKMLSRENFPKQLYLPMQRDLETLKEFFAFGPQDTAKVAKRLRSKSGLVSQEAMDKLVSTEYAKSLAKL